jgi:hypothetical protein
MELSSGFIFIVFKIILDCLKVHWLLYNFVIIQNAQCYRVYRLSKMEGGSAVFQQVYNSRAGLEFLIVEIVIIFSIGVRAGGKLFLQILIIKHIAWCLFDSYWPMMTAF